MIDLVEQKIKDDRDFINQFYSGGFEKVGNALSELPALYDQLENLKKIKATRQKELKALETFASSTNSLFRDSLRAFENAMKGVDVINQSTASADGTITFPAGADMSWAAKLGSEKFSSNLSESKEERYHKSKIKELEKYNIYAMPYEDPKTKEVKIMWFIDKDGVRIFDEELQDYVEKYGKNFVGMYEIVGWEKIYELDLAARRRGDGKNYLTDGQLPSGWEKWGQAGGFADSIYWYSSKSGLLDLALIAGLSYAASKSQTKAGTGVNVVDVMDDVNGIPIGENAVNHLKNVEGVGKKGISGGHNSKAFFESLDEVGGRITSETSHPNISGIKEIFYEVPKKGIDGKALTPPEYRLINRPKTVYDPGIISDKQIYVWGQEAMKNGVIDKREITGIANNGLKFKGFIEDGKITNFFPMLN
ncbi:hypothetical protein Hs30E_05070 [Lactococcus hodotermopsidis]|uniref:Bacterial EndoU nuclease domain-containing protein n=2 Tax=Pseudolactococcus hodotermopsidis TaxID=2709157 RepID=A0A6A0BAW2_9LACT|nr:hypothetical protein Hs30E_05070 [Lactococcus hodotermopsidis]